MTTIDLPNKRRYAGQLPTSLAASTRYYGGGSAPDPTAAAIAGMKESIANYPFTYLINALSQTGGQATLTDPATGKPKTFDFTGLGQQQVGGKVSDQMAQVMLDIQKGYGSQYIQQRLQDLKQSDPEGYAAYQQLFDQINQEAAQTPPNMPLSEATQASMQKVLQGANALTPQEQTQIQQNVRGQNIATGVSLGNAPAAKEATGLVQGLDQKQQAAQTAGQQYLAQGISPSDIQYRKIQQDLANYGAFINKQTPLAQFGQLQGAQQGAAPYSSPYQTPAMTPLSTAAQQGLGFQQSLYGIQSQQANPYMAGLSTALGGIGTASNLYKAFNPAPYGTGGNYIGSGYAGSGDASVVGTGYGTLPSGAAATGADYSIGAVAG